MRYSAEDHGRYLADALMQKDLERVSWKTFRRLFKVTPEDRLLMDTLDAASAYKLRFSYVSAKPSFMRTLEGHRTTSVTSLCLTPCIIKRAFYLNSTSVVSD